jgi:hypothetical protein
MQWRDESISAERNIVRKPRTLYRGHRSELTLGAVLHLSAACGIDTLAQDDFV